jgi:trimeric autotransporter adhesin
MESKFVFGPLAAMLLITPSIASAICNHTPLIVDVKGDGVNLGPPGVGVWFDLDANGSPIHMQWTRAGGDDAFLVADHNGNGVVDNGSELFGDGTNLVLTGEKAQNGFVALQQYDDPALGGNDDGLITNADLIWSSLRIWTDINADGKSQPREVRMLSFHRIKSLETYPKFKPYYDAAGNFIPLYAWATRVPSEKSIIVDVYFAGLPD